MGLFDRIKKLLFRQEQLRLEQSNICLGPIVNLAPAWNTPKEAEMNLPDQIRKILGVQPSTPDRIRAILGVK